MLTSIRPVSQHLCLSPKSWPENRTQEPGMQSWSFYHSATKILYLAERSPIRPFLAQNFPAVWFPLFDICQCSISVSVSLKKAWYLVSNITWITCMIIGGFAQRESFKFWLPKGNFFWDTLYIKDSNCWKQFREVR